MRPFSIKHKQYGAATSVDFMLTFPIFATLMLFIIQMALVLHAQTVVQYAAYKAARSARVQLLDGDHAFRAMDLPDVFDWVNNGLSIAQILEGEFLDSGLFNGNARERVSAAAMNELVAISPASRRYANGAPGSSWDESTFTQYVDLAGSDYTDRTGPLLRKARYAYSDTNTEVDYSFFDITGFGADVKSIYKAADLVRVAKGLNGTPFHSLVDLPVSVTVRYRYELQIPIAQVAFWDRSKPRYSRVLEATVNLM